MKPGVIQYDGPASGSLLSEIDRLERSLDRTKCLSIDALVPNIKHHRQAITLKNFDLSSFKSQPQGSDLLGDIIDKGRDFEDELDAQYRAHYPSEFPFFKLGKFAPFLLFALAAIAVFIAGYLAGSAQNTN